MTTHRKRGAAPREVRATVPFRVIKFSPERHEVILLRFGEWTTATAADLLDGAGKRVTAIRQPNARFDQPWDEDAFREETRRFVHEFNARRLTTGDPVVTRIAWLVRGHSAGDEEVA